MICRRKYIRTVSFLLAAAVCLGVTAMSRSKAESAHADTLKTVRLSALVSLCEYTSQLSAGLRTLAVAADGITLEPASYVCSRALGAKGTAACFGESSVKNIMHFLDGVYAFTENYPDRPNQELRGEAIKLSDYAMELYYHLSDVSNAVMNGEKALLENDKNAEFFENSLDFSNGTEDEIFSLLPVAASPSNEKTDIEISCEEAKGVASGLFGVNSSLWRGGSLENHGGIQVYRFSYGDISVDISSQNGAVVAFTIAEPCSAAQTGADGAAKAAAEFIAGLNFPEMKEISRAERDFRTELEYAPFTNGILHLNATVKISVCRCCAKLIRFDCSEYLQGYQKTTVPNSEINLTTLLPDGFTLTSQSLCIADIDGRARLCYLADCVFEQVKAGIFFDYFSLKPLKSIIRR